MAASSYKKNMA